ncbi:lef-3 [Leucania separata nucleopolyhedrovirus]|uniref:Lef-3 n=1 Tax=Leucania separata nucleopolyhedrovirus TaxID=1307956 RepID=Q0IL37_NPVLS|nr:lef-3 [Leucania separata nucleopolyhedrovirus]AAR28846.1 lef-3 [Leucania separata nucleopolyhedrovirus]
MKRQLSNGGSPMKTSPVKEKRFKNGNETTRSLAAQVPQEFSEKEGELIDKNMISLNNEPFYLLKFMHDDTNVDYYGNMEQYNNMVIGRTYKIKLVYVDRRLVISSYDSSSCDTDVKLTIKKYLSVSDFVEHNVICVEAQFYCGFHIILSNFYKLVFKVRYVNEYGTLSVVQIEAKCDVSRALNLFKADNESELLHNMMEAQNKFFKLIRVKCITTSNSGNHVFKSISFSDISKLEERFEECPDFTDDSLAVVNISRLNKELLYGKVKTINVVAEHMKLKIIYSIEGCEQSAQGTIYINERCSNDEFTRMSVDLKQNASTLHKFNDMYIYTTNDGNYYSVVGITFYDITNKEFVPFK